MKWDTRAVADWIAAKFADLARPGVLWMSGGSMSFSTGWLAWKGGPDLVAGTGFIVAGWAGVAVLYGAKAVEETFKSGQTASLEKVRAGQVPAPKEALAPAPKAAPPPEASDGALRPEDQIQP